MKRIRQIPAVLLLAALLLTLGGLAPASAAEPTGEGFVIPQLDDLPQADLSDPVLMLANSYNSIGLEYVLPVYADLGGQGIAPEARDAARMLLEDARAEGIKIYIGYAYRNWEFLTNHFRWMVDRYGAVEACAHMLPPGCNEHQTGLAIDISDDPSDSGSYGIYDDSSVYDSPAYAWMMEHCTEYGFIYRYPAGKEAWYGTPCNHFHFRYVGKEIAEYIMKSREA